MEWSTFTSVNMNNVALDNIVYTPYYSREDYPGFVGFLVSLQCYLANLQKGDADLSYGS